MTASGILPTYQRFVNGVPVPFSRRSFRPREKYIIILVFLTFGLVCFGTFFFLPEFRGANSTADSVYKVYDQFKRAGPEFLMPPPPLLDEKDSQKIIRHDHDAQIDPHVLDDREKLKAKIEQDDDLKVLERPELRSNVKTSSTSSKVENGKNERGAVEESENGVVSQVVTVPPAYSDHYPDVNHGEDQDSETRERRNKVKEQSGALIGTANFKMLKFEPCDSTDYPLKVNANIRNGDDGVQYISATHEFRVPFGEDSDYNITVDIKKTREAKKFSPLFTLYEESTCGALKKYLGDFVMEMQKAASIEAGQCPVPKGTYTIKDHPLDFKKIAFQSVPAGLMRAKHVITNLKTKEVLMCIIAEVENFPK